MFEDFYSCDNTSVQPLNRGEGWVVESVVDNNGRQMLDHLHYGGNSSELWDWINNTHVLFLLSAGFQLIWLNTMGSQTFSTKDHLLIKTAFYRYPGVCFPCYWTCIYKDHLCIRTTFRWSLGWSQEVSVYVFFRGGLFISALTIWDFDCASCSRKFLTVYLICLSVFFSCCQY